MKNTLANHVICDNRRNARHGQTRLVRPCVAGQPDTSEIVINTTTYLCRCLPGYVELVKACGDKDEEPQVYHLPADLTSCDCGDAVYRQVTCKHAMALRALKAAGKIS